MRELACAVWATMVRIGLGRGEGFLDALRRLQLVFALFRRLVDERLRVQYSVGGKSQRERIYWEFKVLGR